jgi:hypothetical protein
VKDVIVTTLLFTLAYYIGYWRGRKSRDLQHKFECMAEGCGFKVSANREEFVTTMVENHLEHSHPQGF